MSETTYKIPRHHTDEEIQLRIDWSTHEVIAEYVNVETQETQWAKILKKQEVISHVDIPDLQLSELQNICNRGDLLEDELIHMHARGSTWGMRWMEIRETQYGMQGGSSADRRSIISGMAKLEKASRR